MPNTSEPEHTHSEVIIRYVRFPRMEPQRLLLSFQVPFTGQHIVLVDARLQGRQEIRDMLLAYEHPDWPAEEQYQEGSQTCMDAQ